MRHFVSSWVHISLAVAFGLICLEANQALATTLYATSISGTQIDKVDTVTQSVTTYLSTFTAADSIIFDNSGRMLYTELNTGEVWRYDPNTAVTSQIASGFNTPADMVLEPSGTSMLVSEFGGAQIDRIDLNTNAVTNLNVPGIVSQGPEGLAYDGTRLFANLGARYAGSTGKYVAEINPLTGAIISQSPGLNSLDGLTYDPYSGLLYASSLLGNLIYSINPNNLNNFSIVTGNRSVSIPSPDGITTDGIGNLFIASSDPTDQHIYQFNIPSSTLTQNAYVSGLDDLAPASGAGSLPEPNGLLLVVLSLGCLMIGRRHRTARVWRTVPLEIAS